MPVVMTWTWQFLDADGADIARDSPSFPTQADAESWVGESWRELLGDGVEQVSLLDAGAQVYGPMSLRPAE